MRLVKIGVAAVSVKIGDYAGNAARIIEVIESSRAQGVHLLVTPELALSGYSLEDRIWWPDVARRSWDSLERVAEHTKGVGVFVGLPIRMRNLMYNATAYVHEGRVHGLILKRFLPTYSIFYEGRNWTPWREGVTEYNGVPTGEVIFRLPYGMVSAEVCEDLWSFASPAEARVAAGAEIICNGSASPFTPLKNETRKRLVLGAAGSMTCVYAFSNLLGLDNSRLVFDGGGIIAKPDRIVAEGPILSKQPWTLTTGIVDLDEVGRMRAENSTWRQNASNPSSSAVRVVEVDAPYTPASLKEYAAQLPPSFFAPVSRDREDDVSGYLNELFDALVLGLRDYYEKVGVFDRILVALSGGRDSALCLLIAVNAAKALKAGARVAEYASRIKTVYLPNPAYSSAATEAAARGLAEELGVSFQVVTINEESDIALAKAAELSGALERVTLLARQNLQARVRGAMMLNWANSENALVLVTSNLSEGAVGYTTTGGDNQGGYAPIANIPKTLVGRLLEHLAQRNGIRSLKNIMALPPSAELASDQQDEADLMPYAVLDDLLYLFARRRMTLADCWRLLCYRHGEHDAEQLRAWTAKFGRLFAHNQWKREQLPVSLKVLDLDLDPKTGFRFPVTQSIDGELEELRAATLD
ncbi:MAG: NAD(+) synthase [Candidatus Hydrogenedentota bacterium]